MQHEFKDNNNKKEKIIPRGHFSRETGVNEFQKRKTFNAIAFSHYAK
jgi:hypothetical protein